MTTAKDKTRCMRSRRDRGRREAGIAIIRTDTSQELQHRHQTPGETARQRERQPQEVVGRVSESSFLSSHAVGVPEADSAVLLTLSPLLC